MRSRVSWRRPKIVLVEERDGMEWLRPSFLGWDSSFLYLKERIESLYFLFDFRVKIK
jgi:hypothetical protein